MRLIFMGTPAFAVPSLGALIAAGHEVVAVYSQPPRPAGRGQHPTPSPVQSFAEAHHLPVYTPTSLKTPEAQEQFRAHQAEAAIVAAYGLLLPPAILEACPYGCINIHPSDLPRWRGAAPLQRTIMAGDTSSAICIMQMDAGLDTGDVLLRAPFDIAPETTAGELHDRIAVEATPHLLQALEWVASGLAKPEKQSTDGIIYAAKISKEEARINWTLPAQKLLWHIHGLNPFPGAYFEHENERWKILRAMLADGQGIVGEVLDDALTIACGDGALRVVEVQRQGKKTMNTAEALRGHPIPRGTVLA